MRSAGFRNNRSVVAALVAGALAASAGCGGRFEVKAGAAGESSELSPVDQLFEFDAVAVEGDIRRPGALVFAFPSMAVPAKTTLAQVRRRLTRKKTKPRDVHQFVALAAARATELRDQANTTPVEGEGPDDLWAEARASLRRLYEGQGEQVGRTTLELLAAIEHKLGRDDLAIRALEELLTVVIEPAERLPFEIQLTYLLLRAGALDAATAVTGRWGHATRLEQIYLMTWLATLRGEVSAAAELLRSGIGTEAPVRAAMAAEMAILIARSQLPARAAGSLLGALAGGQGVPGKWVAQLSDEYRKAGSYRYAADTLSTVLAQPDRGSLLERVRYRFRQSDYFFQLAEPGPAAKHASEAYRELVECGDACAGEGESVINRIVDLAHFFHTAYSTTYDERYYAPAESLYSLYLEIPDGEQLDAVRTQLLNLQNERFPKDKSQSKHDPQIISGLVTARIDVLRACYERRLWGEAALVGDVRLAFEISDRGEVVGAATDPPPGQSGMAAVGTCLIERVKAWKFPTRAVPGSTRVVVTLEFSPREKK